MDLSSLRKNYRTTINYHQLSKEFLQKRRKNSAVNLVSTAKSPCEVEDTIVSVDPYRYHQRHERVKSSMASLMVSFGELQTLRLSPIF